MVKADISNICLNITSKFQVEHCSGFLQQVGFDGSSSVIRSVYADDNLSTL